MHSKIEDIPLLKITPTGIGNGASDPSGWAWISVLVLAILLIVLLIILL
jgi:hypothetical protein